MRKDDKPVTRFSLTPLARILFATTVLGFAGCTEYKAANNDSGNAPDTAEPAQGGDDYWAELAQNYEPFDKPPGLGKAEPDEWISLGRWEETFDWPVIATGAANLPDGRIVAWSSQTPDTFGGPSESTVGTIYNPADGSFEQTPNSTHDMFCAGISMLEDGRVFVAGGGRTVSTTSVFDADQFNEIEPMAMTRWYPSSTTLASGQVFTSLGTTVAPYPEIWTDGKGWSLIPEISLQPILDSGDVIHNDWYPAFNVAPDGSLFHPGHMPGLLSVYLDQESNVHDHGDHSNDEASRLYNTTVMYDIGKMLIAGGGAGANATNSAMTMDVNGPTPIVTPTNPMKHVRSMQNSVVLPTGEVLVIGGNSSGIQFSDDGTVLEPEIWNPQTEQWRTLDFHDKPRNYHSVALLLKDARVLAAGGGLCGACATNHQNGEIYSPPYLFDANGSPAPRPTITDGSTDALPGDTVSITGTDDIVEFNMLRLVAITHHHTTDQRFVPIDFVKTATGQYDLTLNSNANVLVPGFYWVFGLDQNGTPTEGHTIQINVTPENLPDASPDTSPNIAYEYYEESWPVFELPDFDTLTPVKTGTQADFSLAAKERNKNYAFRFRGSITVPVDGQYTFFLSSDDGSKMLINDQIVVDHDGAHAFDEEESGSVSLAAGQHTIEVQFFEISGGDALLASWQGPTFAKRPISAFDLGSAAPDDSNDNNVTPTAGKVSYRYYEGQWNNLPNFANETVIKAGEVSGFDLSPRIVDDFYGFEFTADITVTNDGDYTFYTRSDDGSRLSVNGFNVVNNDGRHGPKEQSGIIALTAGTHRLTVEFFEYDGGDSLEVQWMGPGIAKQAIPNSSLSSIGGADTDTDNENDPDPDNGKDNDPDLATNNGTPNLVNYQYYEGTWNNLPDFSSITPIKQGESAGFELSNRDRDDFYGMQFSGKLIVPAAGTYTLYSKSDDGSRITIDGQVVVLHDGRHGAIEKQGNITLNAGKHDILVDFFEYDGGDSLKISWAGPGITKQPIPTSALTTESIATGTDPDENTDTDSDSNTDPDTNTDPDVAALDGLVNYQYFEGQWTTIPDFDQLVATDEGQQTGFSLAPQQAADNYGFRFATNLNVPSDGLYAFYLASDDGSRLSIDGQLLIDNDGLHGNRELSDSQFLTAGLHHVLVEYFERDGLDKLKVSWSAAGLVKQTLENASLSSAPFTYNGTANNNTDPVEPIDPVDPITPVDPVDPVDPSVESDIRFEYFEGNWNSLPDFNLLTPVSTGESAQFTLPPNNGIKFYSYRFTGKILVDQTGDYTFYTASNDGSELHINGELVVANDGRHGVKEEQGSLNLGAGLHDIEVTYFQSGGTEALDVFWSGVAMPKQLINSSVLSAP